MAVDRTTEKEATVVSLTVRSEIIHDNRTLRSTRGCKICNDNMAAKRNLSSHYFNCDINESLEQGMINLVWRDSIEATSDKSIPH